MLCYSYVHSIKYTFEQIIIVLFYRRMFPVLSFGVHSLNFTDLYTMEVEVIPSDNNRYKYVSVTGWRVNGVASQQEGLFLFQFHFLYFECWRRIVFLILFLN